MLAFREYGLPPVVGNTPSVLILGSFPSKLSLQGQLYYANPRNQFWKIMADLLNQGVMMDIPAFGSFLNSRHIALWDVIASRAYQEGSMDGDISDPIFNDIPAFLSSHTSIRCIGTNGAIAAKALQKVMRGTLLHQTLPCICLPSTSPAFANCPYDEKLSRWRALLAFLN